MIETLKKLISFRTYSQNIDEIEKTFTWIQQQLEGYPLFIKKFYSNGQPSLIISTSKKKQVKLILQAHIDVVSAPERLFVPKINNGKMFGRGVFDMKYAVACYLYILRELHDSLSEYDFSIIITSDEEIGGKNGVGAILEEGYRGDFCLLPDGGKDWVCEEESKGVWHIKLESFGQSSHGAKPWEGVNAIWNLVNCLTDLQKIFPKESCCNGEHFHNTMSVGKIEGGSEINKVPDYAVAHVDVRYTSETKSNELKNKFFKIIKKHKSVKFSEINFAESHSIKTNNPKLLLFFDIAKKYGVENIDPIRFSRSHGSSDARYFSAKDIPTLVLRPIGGNIHSDKEWINIKDFKIFCAVVKEFVQLVASR